MFPKSFSSIFIKLHNSERNNRILFKDEKKSYTWNDVKGKADDIYSKINSSALKKGSCALIITDDSFLVLSSLVAVWCSNMIPVMPNGLNYNNYRITIQNCPTVIIEEQLLTQEIKQYSKINLIVINKNTVNPIRVNQQFAEQIEFIAQNIEIELQKELVQLTSGSTGTPKKISRTLESLYLENITLTKLLLNNVNLRELFLISTVPNFHAYGIEFRLLLPILNNICSGTTMITYQEQFKKLDNNKIYLLITSPGFIKRLDETRCELNIFNIVSAGGKLDERAFKAIAAFFSMPVFDVLGSTETGVMAYRKTYNSQTLMKPNGNNKIFVLNERNVLLTVGKGKLAVESEYIPHAFKQNFNDQSNNNHSVFISEDLIELFDNQEFENRGRACRTIKIEDNRISLDDIEKAIMQLDIIMECAVVPLMDNHRESTAAMIVLSQQGKEFYKNHSKGKLLLLIRSNLKNIIQIALPRKLVIAESLPQTPNGKINYQSIKELVKNEISEHRENR